MPDLSPVLLVGYVIALGIAILATFIVWSRTGFPSLPLPPGPTTSWFGGVSLPVSHPWRTYAGWRSIYGDIIYMYTFGNPIIIVNSAQAATDLLEKRSSNYSSRPVRTMVQELMGWDWLFSSMPYGARWRSHRSLFQKHFPLSATQDHHPIQEKEAHALLRNLSRSPEKLSHHVRRNAAALVMRIAYGHKVSEDGDVYVTIADQAMTGLARAGIYGTYIVDYLPLLKYIPSWVPGAAFQKQAQRWKQASHAMINQPFDMVRQKMESGTAVPCFTTTELEEWSRAGQDPEQLTLIKNVAGIFYAGGSETVIRSLSLTPLSKTSPKTATAILTFFLAMIMFPDCQLEAQKQLDSVLGPDHLPQFSDRSALPFIDCLVWETLRWNPAVPLALARIADDDDEYAGYRIPKGTTILPNVWAMFHDETKYPDPLRFSPERFEDEKKNRDLGINDLPHAAFGFGRRVCPGRWLALDTMWITIASVLTVYNISKTVSNDGTVIEPDAEPFTSGLMSRPKPMNITLTPRSEAACALIRQISE